VGDTTGPGPTTESEPAPPATIDVRQQLAADRTLLAWIRTSIALAALGFVVARFDLLARQTTNVSTGTWHNARIVGVGLVVVSVLVGLLGLYQYRQVTELLAAHGDDAPISRAPAIIGSLFMLVVLVGLVVYLITGVK
jgi:putative membrane protein